MILLTLCLYAATSFSADGMICSKRAANLRVVRCTGPSSVSSRRLDERVDPIDVNSARPSTLIREKSNLALTRDALFSLVVLNKVVTS